MPLRDTLRHSIERIERRLLPPNLADASQRVRARVFLWGAWLGATLALSGLATQLALGYSGPREQLATIAIALILAVAPCLARLVLNVTLIVTLTHLIIIAALVFAATERGGIWAAFSVVVVALPAFAILSGRTRAGLISLIAASLALTGLLIAHLQATLTTPQITSDETIQHAVTMLFVMGELFVFVALHERIAARALERQRLSEARYARVLSATQDGVFEWHHDRIARSAAFCAHLHCAPETLPSHTLIPDALLDPASRQRYQDAIDACWQHRTPIDLELKLTTADGAERWFQLRADHACEPSPETSPHILGTLRDISTHKHMEQRRTDFVSMVSHEIRTPLTSIQGAIGLVQGGALGPISPPVQHTLTLAVRNTERLAKLAEDLLDLKRLDADQLNVYIETLALNDVLAQSIALNLGFAQRFNVPLRLGHVPPHAYLSADPARLHQILSNLLSNAVKHSPSDAPVVLSASLHTEPDGTARVLIHVQDHGPGLPPDVRANLFGRFVQSSLRPSSEGVGLGLHISHLLAQRMRGALTFDPSHDPGTRFSIALPSAPQPSPPAYTTLEMPQATVGETHNATT